jgi:hypothetical protein
MKILTSSACVRVCVCVCNDARGNQHADRRYSPNVQQEADWSWRNGLQSRFGIPAQQRQVPFLELPAQLPPFFLLTNRLAIKRNRLIVAGAASVSYCRQTHSLVLREAALRFFLPLPLGATSLPSAAA